MIRKTLLTHELFFMFHRVLTGMKYFKIVFHEKTCRPKIWTFENYNFLSQNILSVTILLQNAELLLIQVLVIYSQYIFEAVVLFKFTDKVRQLSIIHLCLQNLFV